MTAIVDAGPLYAAADRDDVAHSVARDLLTRLPGPLLVPTPVLTEAEYMIRSRVSYEAARKLVADIVGGGLRHVPLEEADLDRTFAVMEAHPGIELGLADAAIVALAERLKIRTVVTFDHRDLRRVRPAHTVSFELVPSEADLQQLRERRR